MGKHLLFMVAFSALMTGAQAPVPPFGPQNLAFTNGEVGSVPPGWFVATPGYSARLTAEEPFPGKRAVEIDFIEKQAPFGNLMQSFDATPYRGKQVRFRAAVRVTGAGPADQAQLWFRVDRQSGKIGFFDNMGNRPIRTPDWRYFEIIAVIDRDAQTINIGLMLLRMGRVWIADASLDVLGDLPQQVIEAPRPLTPRGLRNEVAFAKLFGYVRYFHPSDEGAKTDWNVFAITGAREIEGARDDTELAQKLAALFDPASPTVRVLTSGQSYSMPTALKPPAGDPKVTYWKHFGVGIQPPERSIYRSERIQETASAAARSKAPLPESPFKAELVPGVTAWVPLALYVDDKGTLPHPAVETAAASSSIQPKWSADERGTRLGDVVVAWNVFQHFYPYFDVGQTDWMAELPRGLEAAATDKDEDAFAVTLQRLVAALHDGHGSVTGTGQFFGYLPVLWDWVENGLVITEAGPSTAGLVFRGDVVLKIDGRPAADVLAVSEALVSGATPQWVRYRGLQELTRGQVGKTVVLEIESANDSGKPKSVTLQFLRAAPPLEQRPAKIAELEPGVYYVDIGRVTDADFQGALADLQKARGIIFDFRGYPGNIGPNFLRHLSDKPMTSAQWHVPWVLRPDHEDLQFERRGGWDLQPMAPLLTANRAFITDGRAISYAESCMGIVQNYKLGAIVGSPTAGTNGNVNPFPLPGGYTITWTGMRVLKHDGSRHHGVGILPTIPVSRSRFGIAAGRDEFLERAVAAVKN